MSPTIKVAVYSAKETLRSKWTILYTLFFSAVTAGLFQLEGQTAKVMVSLISISLILIPLISILFGALYYYNSREFVELLLTQPLRRRTVFMGMYTGLAISLIAGFITGIIVPCSLFGGLDSSHLPTLLLLLFTGSCLTASFTAIAFAIAVVIDDKGKGLGAAIFAWLGAAILYDGIILLIAYAFADYPLEKPMLIMTALNPIDLARVALLIKADMAAMMGYTGAVFSHFFAGWIGIMAALSSLLGWIIVPFAIGLNRFSHRDF